MKQRPGVLKRQREADQRAKTREKEAKRVQRKADRAERALLGPAADDETAAPEPTPT